MIHGLKIRPQEFEDVVSGKKLFEIRFNDREYKVGDLLALNEFDPEAKKYTDRSCLVYVDYIYDNAEFCKDGFIVMSIKPCAIKRVESYLSVSSMAADYSVPLATPYQEDKIIRRD